MLDMGEGGTAGALDSDPPMQPRKRTTHAAVACDGMQLCCFWRGFDIAESGTAALEWATMCPKRERLAQPSLSSSGPSGWWSWGGGATGARHFKKAPVIRAVSRAVSR